MRPARDHIARPTVSAGPRRPGRVDLQAGTTDIDASAVPDVLAVVAVAGHPVPIAALWAVDVLAGIAVDEVVAALEADGRVSCDDDAFVSMTAEAAADVVARLGGITRSRLRGALGKVLVGGGPVSVEDVVGHRLAGLAVRPDADAADAIRRQAEDLAAQGELDRAAAVYTALIDVTDRFEEGALVATRCRVHLASIERWRGDVHRAEALLAEAAERARRSDDARLLAAASLNWSELEIAVDDDPAAVSLLDAALARLGHADDGLRSQLLAQRAHRTIFRDLEAARHDADTAVALARAVDDPIALILAAYAWRVTHWHPDHLERSLALADEMLIAGRFVPEYAEHGAIARLQTLHEQGEMVRFDRELEVMARRNRHRSRPFDTVWLETMAAGQAARRGEWDVALARADAALERGRGARYEPVEKVLAALRLGVAWQRGEPAELPDRPEVVAGPLAEAWRVLVLGWTATRRPVAEVLRAVDEVLDGGVHAIRPDLSWGVTIAGLATAVADAADGLVPATPAEPTDPTDATDAGEPVSELERLRRHAAALLEVLTPHEGAWGATGGVVTSGPFGLHIGRLRRVVGDAAGAEDALRRAETACRTAGARPWLSRCLVALAGLDALADDERRALATEACELATELDQREVAAQARRRLTSLGRVALPAGLTEREGEVLALVVSGESNRTTAERLFVSVKTVERHLLNIYSKLGVHSRTEASVWAHRHGLAPPDADERPEDLPPAR